MIDINPFKDLLFSAHPSRNYVVALSGGRDSMVLCDLLLQLSDHCSWRAIHVNHRLHQDAYAWEEHVKRWCNAHGVPFEAIQLNDHWQGGQSQNVEARARIFRYSALIKACLPGEIVLTAHHQSDQAETFLLQLLRGSGLPGLSAMPMRRLWGGRVILRPLLSYPSIALAEHAMARCLSFIDDPSNASLTHRRNFIRHQIMPALESVWPQVSSVVARSASHCAEGQSLLDEFASSDFKEAFNVSRDAMDMQVLERWSLARQKNVIRYWLRINKVPMPEQKRLETFLAQCQARMDRMPMMAWSNVSLRRFQAHLYCVPRQPRFNADWEVTCSVNASLRLPEPLGVMGLEQWVVGESFCLGQTYQVRFRRGGEVFRPKGCPHHVGLKDWFQRQELPPWCRGIVPLLFDGTELVAVGLPRWVMRQCHHHPIREAITL